ncbi:MAG: helicase-related protein, partial [Halobacteriaceae archaeon]
MQIRKKYGKPLLNVVLDAVEQDKQCLVFVNTRRSAEAQAEHVSDKLTKRLPTLADDIANVLSQPTQQCERLGKCVRNGAAFHHSGLHHEQRDLVEDAFKERKISCICATPTLAMGIDMPAFRVVIRDLKRFGDTGMDWIPVLE